METQNHRGTYSPSLSEEKVTVPEKCSGNDFFCRRITGVVDLLKEYNFKLDRNKEGILSSIYDNKFPCII